MATELGQAYVQIMPSAKGISGSISKQLEPESSSAGKSAGGNIASSIKNVILAAGIGAAIGKAINMGGELQQNLGGTEAVFGDFAGKIQESANSAYKNMGMSASEYMGTANKMGSLFQGSGLTQQQALDMTSSAMQRAADVASVMGVDTSTAMESISGAAKGNFAMMDNLGVAMNATSLQAYALEKGINFDWNTATQAEKSELAMKMFMDRTSQYSGNFAKESEQTFSGSLGAMKSSFQDVLATMSTGGDVGPALEGLSKSVVSFADNLLPMVSGVVTQIPGIIVTLLTDSAPQLLDSGMKAIGDIVTGLGTAMPTLIPQAVTAITTLINGLIANIPMLITAAITLITGLSNGLVAAIPILTTQIPIIINALVTALTENLPALIMAGVTLFTSLVSAIPEIIPVIVAVLPTIINSIVTALFALLPQIIEAGIGLFTSLVQALPQIIEAIVAVMPLIVAGITGASNKLIPLIVEAGIQLITALVDNLPAIISEIVKALPKIIDAIVKVTLQSIPLIIQAGIALLTALLDARDEIISQITAALPAIVIAIVTTLIENLPLIVEAGVSLLTSLIQSLPLIIRTLVGAMPGIVSGIATALVEGVPKLVEVGAQLLAGLAKGIGNAVGGVISKAKEVAGNIVSSVKGFFGIKSPSRVFTGIGEQLDAGLAGGIADNVKPITKAMDKVGELTTRSFESDIVFNTPANLRSLSTSINSGIRTEYEIGGQQHAMETRMISALEKYLPIIAQGKNILLDGDKLVGGLYDKIDEMVAFKQRENELAYGG